MSNNRRRLYAAAGGVACAAALAIGGTAAANASTQTGNIYSSNGEAGYYTWSASPFNENYAFVTPTAVAEQMGSQGGVGLQLGALSSVNVYKQSVGQECYVAQIGLVWNNTEKAFDVVAGTGTITYDPSTTNVDNGTTNPDACTTGGALPSSDAIAHPGTDETQTADEDGYVIDTTWSEDFLQGIPAGDQVYLNELRVGSGNIKFTAYDNDATFNSGAVYTNSNVFSSGNPHFAGAGTVFDLTNRTAAVQNSSDQEAAFYLLRAGQWDHIHGHWSTQVNVYNAWLAQQVVSSANGQQASPPAVTPFNTLNHPYGGMFNLYVGSPVGP